MSTANAALLSQYLLSICFSHFLGSQPVFRRLPWSEPGNGLVAEPTFSQVSK